MSWQYPVDNKNIKNWINSTINRNFKFLNWNGKIRLYSKNECWSFHAVIMLSYDRRICWKVTCIITKWNSIWCWCACGISSHNQVLWIHVGRLRICCVSEHSWVADWSRYNSFWGREWWPQWNIRNNSSSRGYVIKYFVCCDSCLETI